MAKNKIGRGYKWTPEEDALLKELYPECPIPEIAKRLGRTVSAVKNHAHQLGIRRKNYLENLEERWTAEELQLLRELYSTCESTRELAEKIGRSPNAVMGKANSIGLSRRHRTYDL